MPRFATPSNPGFPEECPVLSQPCALSMWYCHMSITSSIAPSRGFEAREKRTCFCCRPRLNPPRRDKRRELLYTILATGAADVSLLYETIGYPQNPPRSLKFKQAPERERPERIYDN